jgi:predicted O-methyltransferase YrrM
MKLRNWTPYYVRCRLRNWTYYRRNQNKPWLTQDALAFLEGWLRPGDEVLEFGAGRSTIYFASRCAKVISFEDNEKWCRRVQGQIERLRLTNAEIRHRADDRYNYEVLQLPDRSVDVVLIDGNWVAGRSRMWPAINSLRKLRPGGIMVFDNINWYVPSGSRSPNSIRELQPEDPNHARTIEFLSLTKAWRRVWSTNGIWDTLILFCDPAGV